MIFSWNKKKRSDEYLDDLATQGMHCLVCWTAGIIQPALFQELLFKILKGAVDGKSVEEIFSARIVPEIESTRAVNKKNMEKYPDSIHILCREENFDGKD